MSVEKDLQKTIKIIYTFKLYFRLIRFPTIDTAVWSYVEEKRPTMQTELHRKFLKNWSREAQRKIKVMERDRVTNIDSSQLSPAYKDISFIIIRYEKGLEPGTLFQMKHLHLLRFTLSLRTPLPNSVYTLEEGLLPIDVSIVSNTFLRKDFQFLHIIHLNLVGEVVRT
ncbi:hypothetical protein GQ43DRAFT_240369 [Delitschia confertaspora ATCC 74209]|uniref:Uncharacterized protein n=1 Tax=Delitschia confertaspora ATCC 74209 TaxID=1513339 RepID=A0A9P4JCG6_9PLEO|nr:hypothetical protein GQ43DRAFT_240369 [Delitschia confertaspora ATCC 74209]